MGRVLNWILLALAAAFTLYVGLSAATGSADFSWR